MQLSRRRLKILYRRFFANDSAAKEDYNLTNKQSAKTLHTKLMKRITKKKLPIV